MKRGEFWPSLDCHEQVRSTENKLIDDEEPIGYATSWEVERRGALVGFDESVVVSWDYSRSQVNGFESLVLAL